MTESTSRKTDTLNLRLEAEMAAEIQRIAEWRGSSASEIARELMRHGIAVERQLQAQELRRGYDYAPIDRNPRQGYLNLDAEWRWFTPEEIAAQRAWEESVMELDG